MKILLFCLIAALLPSAAAAQDLFAVGTTWEITFYSDADPFLTYTKVLVADRTLDCDGKPCIAIRNETKDCDFMYLWVDGEKVYFTQNETNPQWKLLYDFGVTPEEERTVYSVNREQMTNGEDSWYDTTLKCVSVDETSGEIIMNETEGLKDPSKAPVRWIRGVGTPWGLHVNAIFPDIYGGGGHRLIRCYIGDTILYSDPEASIATPTGGGSMESEAYDLLGRKVSTGQKGLIIVNGSKRIIR